MGLSRFKPETAAIPMPKGQKPSMPFARVHGRIVAPNVVGTSPVSAGGRVVFTPDPAAVTYTVEGERRLVATAVTCQIDKDGYLVSDGQRWVDLVAPGEEVTPEGMWSYTVEVYVLGYLLDPLTAHVTLKAGQVADIAELLATGVPDKAPAPVDDGNQLAQLREEVAALHARHDEGWAQLHAALVPIAKTLAQQLSSDPEQPLDESVASVIEETPAPKLAADVISAGLKQSRDAKQAADQATDQLSSDLWDEDKQRNMHEAVDMIADYLLAAAKCEGANWNENAVNKMLRVKRLTQENAIKYLGEGLETSRFYGTESPA